MEGSIGILSLLMIPFFLRWLCVDIFGDERGRKKSEKGEEGKKGDGHISSFSHFPHFSHLRHPGTTLIELLIFIAVLAIVATAVIPLLFASTEDRLLQQTASIVEQNGSQILQMIEYHVHHAERVLDPLIHGTGAVLALQSGSGGQNPTIIGISSGALVLVEHTSQQIVSSSQVGVQNLVVRNTSISSSRQSVYVSFRVTRAIRLQLPHVYSKVFEGVFTLYPADEPQGAACSCAVPGCNTSSGAYAWQVCNAGTCLNVQTPMVCK